jgi:hypothetical protein
MVGATGATVLDFVEVPSRPDVLSECSETAQS